MSQFHKLLGFIHTCVRSNLIPKPYSVWHGTSGSKIMSLAAKAMYLHVLYITSVHTFFLVFLDFKQHFRKSSRMPLMKFNTIKHHLHKVLKLFVIPEWNVSRYKIPPYFPSGKKELMVTIIVKNLLTKPWEAFCKYFLLSVPLCSILDQMALTSYSQSLCSLFLYWLRDT